jgi:hypothetical protein
MVMKVERQLKQKGIVQKSPPLSSSTPWKPNWKANIRAGQSQPIKEGKAEYPREKKYISAISKCNNDTPTFCNCDIKCFCCVDFGHVTP